MKKEFKSEGIFKNKGAGDVLLAVSKKIGLSTMVKWAWGEDCGCDERAEKLNKLYRRESSYTITEGQALEIVNVLQAIDAVGGKTNQVSGKALAKIYNEVFKAKERYSGCGGCNKRMVKGLVIVLQANQYKFNETAEVEVVEEDEEEARRIANKETFDNMQDVTGLGAAMENAADSAKGLTKALSNLKDMDVVPPTKGETKSLIDEVKDLKWDPKTEGQSSDNFKSGVDWDLPTTKGVRQGSKSRPKKKKSK